MTQPKAKGKKARQAKPPTIETALSPTLGKPPKRAKAVKVARRPLDAAYLEDLCAHIAKGESLRSFGRLTNHADEVLVRWIQADIDRTKAYREARRMQADAHIDQLIELSDEPMPINSFGSVDTGAVQQLRVRIDTRKWIAAKLHPAAYGDKLEVNASLSHDGLKPDQVMGRIVALLATHGLKVMPEQAADEAPAE